MARAVGVISNCALGRKALRLQFLYQWRSRVMLRTVGFLMQLAVLALLPMLILWQLMFGFRLVLMPMLTLAGIIIFTTGHWLREA